MSAGEHQPTRRGASPFPEEHADARADAGRAVRDVGHALIGHHADTATIEALTAELQRWVATLTEGERRQRVIERPTGDWGPAPSDGQEMFSFDERPISGRSSPLGVDARIVRDGDEVVAYITLDSAHEGAPGRSHGGVTAALFDDVMGFVLTVEQQPAFTGELAIRYEAGVPIHEPLECRVRLAGRERRKLYVTGELTSTGADPVVYARARGTFIAIDAAAFRINPEASAAGEVDDGAT
ncbi:MAG: PaaI family thioesterase [Actinomycetota bacterium]